MPATAIVFYWSGASLTLRGDVCSRTRPRQNDRLYTCPTRYYSNHCPITAILTYCYIKLDKHRSPTLARTHAAHSMADANETHKKHIKKRGLRSKHTIYGVSATKLSSAQFPQVNRRSPTAPLAPPLAQLLLPLPLFCEAISTHPPPRHYRRRRILHGWGYSPHTGRRRAAMPLLLPLLLLPAWVRTATSVPYRAHRTHTTMYREVFLLYIHPLLREASSRKARRPTDRPQHALSRREYTYIPTPQSRLNAPAPVSSHPKQSLLAAATRPPARPYPCAPQTLHPRPPECQGNGGSCAEGAESERRGKRGEKGRCRDTSPATDRASEVK